MIWPSLRVMFTLSCHGCTLLLQLCKVHSCGKNSLNKLDAIVPPKKINLSDSTLYHSFYKLLQHYSDRASLNIIDIILLKFQAIAPELFDFTICNQLCQRESHISKPEGPIPHMYEIKPQLFQKQPSHTKLTC